MAQRLLTGEKGVSGYILLSVGGHFGLAFPDVYLKPHMSKEDTMMLRDICRLLASVKFEEV